MSHSDTSRRPFVARIIRRFAVPIVLAWVALMVVLNVAVPQLEPVTEANRGPLVPVDPPRRKRSSTSERCSTSRTATAW